MATSRTIKVRIPVTVEIDFEAWCDNYGCESAVEVREDAKRHIADMVRQQLLSVGVLADAE